MPAGGRGCQSAVSQCPRAGGPGIRHVRAGQTGAVLYTEEGVHHLVVHIESDIDCSLVSLLARVTCLSEALEAALREDRRRRVPTLYTRSPQPIRANGTAAEQQRTLLNSPRSAVTRTEISTDKTAQRVVSYRDGCAPARCGRELGPRVRSTSFPVVGTVTVHCQQSSSCSIAICSYVHCNTVSL